MTPGEEGRAVSLVATVCEDPSCVVCGGGQALPVVVAGGRDGQGVVDERVESHAGVAVLTSRRSAAS